MPYRSRYHRLRWYQTIPEGTIRRGIIVFLLMYCAPYLLLSAAGRWGMSWNNLEWQPAGISFYASSGDGDHGAANRASLLGYFYAPLILVDRALVHRSIPRGSPQAEEVLRGQYDDSAIDAN